MRLSSVARKDCSAVSINCTVRKGQGPIIASSDSLYVTDRVFLLPSVDLRSSYGGGQLKPPLLRAACSSSEPTPHMVIALSESQCRYLET